jgi:hypothetical protein
MAESVASGARVVGALNLRRTLPDQVERTDSAMHDHSLVDHCEGGDEPSARPRKVPSLQVLLVGALNLRRTLPDQVERFVNVFVEALELPQAGDRRNSARVLPVLPHNPGVRVASAC